jgi:tRNA(Arg) A34 adenosine deaminase TadA
MQYVVRASAANVSHGTGGPFAAAVFEHDSGALVSLGVNLVTTQNLSVLHAEIVAISLAQRRLGTFDLGREDLPRHALFSSTEPCAMCFGAIPWSGVHFLFTGAYDADAREVGFDEGPKVSDWVSALQARHIAVTKGLQRDAARQVLLDYRDSGGIIYNPRAVAKDDLSRQD